MSDQAQFHCSGTVHHDGFTHDRLYNIVVAREEVPQ